MVIPFIEITQGPQCILCLPGLDCARSLIDRVAAHLDGEVTLLWADYNQVKGLNYANAAATLERAIEAHRPVAIMAESFGSTVAMTWALEHPGRGIPMVLTGPLSWTRRRWCAGAGRFAAIVVPDLLRPPCVWAGSQFVVSPRADSEVRRLLIQDFCRIPRRAWIDRVGMLLEVDLRPRLSEIRTPMTLMWGENDRVVWGYEEAEVFRSAGHGDAVEIVADGGHSLWASSPKVVADRVRRHLGNGAAPPPQG